MPGALFPSWVLIRQRFRAEGPQVLRILVAAASSWQLCVWLGATAPPVFAVVVPLVALRDHPYSAFNLSVDRMIGVLGGVLLAEAMVQLFGISLLTVTAVLAIGLSVGVVLRVGTALNVQIAVSAMLVFASADPDGYAFARIWETAVGAAVCIVLSPLLLPPDARRSFEAALEAVTGALADQLAALRTLVDEPPDGALDHAALAELSSRAVRTEEAARGLPETLVAAERAVRHNPLRRGDVPRLARHTEVVSLATEVARIERLLLEEVLDLSTRPDLHQVWPDFREPMLRVLEPAETGVRIRLVENRTDDQLAALCAAGDAEILRWRELDPRPIAAVMRRPLRRLLDVLGGGPRRPLDLDDPGKP